MVAKLIPEADSLIF